MIRLITRDEIAKALLQEPVAAAKAERTADTEASRRRFLNMRKRYQPLSDLLRDLRTLQEENLHLKETVTDLTLEVCRLIDQQYQQHK